MIGTSLFDEPEKKAVEMLMRRKFSRPDEEIFPELVRIFNPRTTADEFQRWITANPSTYRFVSNVITLPEFDKSAVRYFVLLDRYAVEITDDENRWIKWVAKSKCIYGDTHITASGKTYRIRTGFKAYAGSKDSIHELFATEVTCPDGIIIHKQMYHNADDARTGHMEICNAVEKGRIRSS